MNFIRALGLRDLALMNVVAVVGMRWIARGARTGPASVTLWVRAGCWRSARSPPQPPGRLAPRGSNALTYEVNLIVQAAIMLALGLALYVWSRRSN